MRAISFTCLLSLAAVCGAQENAPTPLADQLQETANGASKRLPKAVLKTFKEGVQTVKDLSLIHI